MKIKMTVQIVVPKARREQSVRFRSGSGSHRKTEKYQRANIKLALKKGQEVFLNQICQSKLI